jgi:glycosyltransferase involved in cell wall biosynthesis
MDGVGVCVENYARHLGFQGHQVAVAAPWAPVDPEKSGEKAGSTEGSSGHDGAGSTDRDERSDPFELFRYASIPLPGWKPYRLGVPRLDWSFHTRLDRWIDEAFVAGAGAGGSQRRLQIVHSHSPFVAGKLGQRLARRHGALHVTTFHSKYRDDFMKSVPSNKLARLFVRRIVRFYESADAVWTPSEATAETLRSYGFSGEVTVMPNGADLDPPDEASYEVYRRRGADILGVASSSEAGGARAGDGPKGDPFVLLFVGQHRWEKNLRLVIDGLAELSPEVAGNVRAVFAGTGSDAKDIEAYAKKRQVSKLCDFRGLVLDREILKALYARADLFMFPSLYDNAPLVLREAAAFRTPAVLAAGSSAAADTEDGRNAFHVNPEPESLARLIVTLSRDPEAVNRVGRRAQEEVYRGWREIVAEVAELYEALLAARRG